MQMVSKDASGPCEDDFKAVVQSVVSSISAGDGFARKVQGVDSRHCQIICRDQSVGLVGETCLPELKNFKQRIFIDEEPEMRHDASGRIVLLLESPHRYEFTSERKGLSPKGPAYGKTGSNIRKFLKNIIPLDFGDIDSHELILVNAVQFQCSLGLPLWNHPDNQKFKNAVVTECLRQKAFRNHLRCRVQSLVKGSTDIIAIASGQTSGVNQRVEGIVHDLTRQLVAGMGHPSSWGFRR